MPGVHVAHFYPMCLTARNGLRHPKSPVMPRTSPTRFDAWSSRGGRLEWTLGGHPHVLGRRVVRWKGWGCPFMPPARARARCVCGRGCALPPGGERTQSHGGACRVCKLCALFGGPKSLGGSQIFYFFIQPSGGKKILILSTLFSKKVYKVCKACSTPFILTRVTQVPA